MLHFLLQTTQPTDVWDRVLLILERIGVIIVSLTALVASLKALGVGNKAQVDASAAKGGADAAVAQAATAIHEAIKATSGASVAQTLAESNTSRLEVMDKKVHDVAMASPTPTQTTNPGKPAGEGALNVQT